jgi:hypothetical protein
MDTLDQHSIVQDTKTSVYSVVSSPFLHCVLVTTLMLYSVCSPVLSHCFLHLLSLYMGKAIIRILVCQYQNKIQIEYIKIKAF